MKPFRALTALIVASTLPTLATAQMPKPESVCLSGNNDGDTAHNKLVAELLKIYKPTLISTDFSKSPLETLVEVAVQDDECAKTDSACTERKKLTETVLQFLLDGRSGNFSVQWSENAKGNEPAATNEDDLKREMLTAFFTLDEPTYSVQCTGASPSADWPLIKISNLIIAETPTDLSKTADKRANAVFSVTLDRANPVGLKDANGDPIVDENGDEVFVDNDDFKFKGVLALKPIPLWKVKQNESGEAAAQESGQDRVYLSATPFVSLNYDNNLSPSDEIDDLGFGAQFTWDLDSELWPEKLYLTPQWITDIEQRESSQFAVEAKSTLPLHSVFGTKFTDRVGYAADRSLVQNPSLKFYWKLDAVADYGDIQDVGDKTELETVEKYARLGYDLKAQLALQRNENSGIWGLSGSYQYRDDFDSGMARMDLVDVTASYKPPGKSNFSFELSYDRGENLTSLKPIETFTVGLGFHN